MKQIDRQIRASLKDIIINKRRAGYETKDDLLGMLLESNMNEIQHGNDNNNVGMSIEDVIEESKLFYFAGQETTSALLVWTMILLSRYPNWQARAIEEVLVVLGNNDKPDFDDLTQLKVVSAKQLFDLES